MSASRLPRRHPDGPFPAGAVLSADAVAGPVETVASSLLATCGYLRRLVAGWEARAGLLTDRADAAEGVRAVELRAEAETCIAHADELRTVLNTGRK